MGSGWIFTSSNYEPFASGTSLGLPESQPPHRRGVRPARFAGPWVGVAGGGTQAFQCFRLRLEGLGFRLRGPSQGLGRPQRNRGSGVLGAMCAGCREGRRGHACGISEMSCPRSKAASSPHAATVPVPGIQQVLRQPWANSSRLLYVWMRGLCPTSALQALA